MRKYDQALSLAEARKVYFRENQFGADGGYGDAWVDFKFGPVPFPFSNTPPRVRAVKYHNLHRVVTEYGNPSTSPVVGGPCAWRADLAER